MGLVLSVDVGTSNIKSAVVDRKGNLITLARRSLKITRENLNSAEHQADTLIQTMFDCMKEAIGEHAGEISIISTSSYQLGLMLLDEEGNLLTQMTTLRDTRSRETYEEYLGQFDPTQLYQQTGCPPFFIYTAPRLFFFRKENQEMYGKVKTLLTSKSYIMKKLTGELISDPSTEAATQLFSLERKAWDSELVELLGLSKDKFPSITDPYKESFSLLPNVSKELGLNNDVKVITGVYDGGALCLGLGGTSEGSGVINLGTTGMLRTRVETPVLDKSELMRLQTYHFIDDSYLTGGAINNGFIPLQWLRDQFPGETIPNLINLAGKSNPGSEKLIFLPYLTGERDWTVGNYASGVLFGLNDSHAKSDVVRSVLEGVSCSMMLIKKALVDNGIELSRAKIGGGGTHSKLWMTILANVLGIPLEVSTNAETALVGNAVLGYMNLKEYKTSEEAQSEMIPPGEIVRPQDSLVSLYKDYFELYSDLFYSLKPIFMKHSKFKNFIQ